MKRQTTYVIWDAGRMVGITRATAGRHGEHVEYGYRTAEGPLYVKGWAHILLPSKLGRDSQARAIRHGIKRGDYRALDVA